MSHEASGQPATAEPAPGQPLFPVLDTLRAVGALGVLTTHTAFWAGAYTAHGPWGAVLARLDVGVAIFFVLSGFLLSRPWLDGARRGTGGPAVGRYAWKRVLRIMPVYVVTAVLALTFIEANDDLGAADWLVTLTLTDIYVSNGPPDGLTQMWSLATEVAFYAALPVLMLLAVGRARRLVPVRVVAVLAGLSLLTVLWLGVLSGTLPGAEELAVNQWLPGFLTWFSLGIGLALLDVVRRAGTLPVRLDRAVTRLASAPGVCWTVAGAAVLVAATPLAGPTLLLPPSDAEAVTKNLLYAVVGGLLVFSGVFTAPGSGYHRLMSHRALRHLGHISYSLFCLHLPILHLVMWTTGYELFGGHLLGIFTLTLVLSLVAAEVAYRLVELPAMRFKDVGRRAEAASTAPTATTTR